MRTSLNHICLTFVSMLMFCSSIVFAQTSTDNTNEITGKVVDANTQHPISQVNVILVGTRLGGATDREGQFTIQNVPPGTYTLKITRIGYEDVLYEKMTFNQKQDLNISITPIAHQLKEITVTPGTFSFMETGSSTRQTMSREDIESVPQFGEDIFRAVNRLPGLSAGDYSAHFSIRGGRHDETLIILDGLEIYEPYHLKDFNEGAISIIDVETIEGVELMTGGFPAEYGNKQSGVFNITSRASKEDQKRFSIGLSFMNARAMTEGTFANGKGSWFLSARRGYLDLVFNLMNQNDLPSPVYYDIFSKIRYEMTPRHTLSFNVLHARDKYTFDSKATTGFQDTINTVENANNRYGNSYAWLTLKSALASRVAVTSLASVGKVDRSRGGAEIYTATQAPIYSLTNNRDFNILGFKQDWLLEPSNSLLVEFGYDFKRLTSNDTFNNYVDRNPDDPSTDTLSYYPVKTTSIYKKDGTTLGGYLTNRIRIIDPFTLELGLRYDRASYTADSDWSPRVNALFRLAEKTNLRVGWGYYRQMQGIEDVAALNGQDQYYPSELSKQWTAGLEQAFANGAMLRVEGYQKRGSNLRPRYRNWKGSPDVFLETNEDRILVYPTKSESKGIEVYYKQNMGRKLSITGSYALASIKEITRRVDNINDPLPIFFDSTHPNPQDQQHALNLDCTYRPVDSWSINMSYAFHSGWPATHEEMVQVTGDHGETDFAIKPLQLYGSRLPDYHRMDVRITKKYPTSRGNIRFFFEVVNLTNHNNIFGYDYFKALNTDGQFYLQRDAEKWFTILPSIGLSWSSGF